MYGQTEATARLSILSPEEWERKPGSIGRGIPGVQLQVVNDEGQPVAAGEEGEIVARGENIMLGYWNDAEETARTLQPEGLRTGDLARVDADGYITIVGRKSDIIKSGAYRLHPAEIEAVIAAHPLVAEAAVVGLADEIWGERPVAYVVRTQANKTPGGVEVRAEEIIEFCRGRLPRHKAVREVRFVEKLPRTSSGKIRRDELRRIAHP
jgi:acyl-CoA synthetase (AMP-forming)/AMP-acid ligase II